MRWVLTFGLGILCWLAATLFPQDAAAYYSFVRQGARSRWLSPVSITLSADMSFLRAPATTINCADAAPTEYTAVAAALATWDSLANADLTLAFACSGSNFDDANLDTLVYNRTTNTLAANLENEIVFDDTGDIINSLGLDDTSLLGLAFPFDSAGVLINENNSNGDISTAFILLNASLQLDNTEYQAIMTHELGHVLGLGHTPSLNQGLNNSSKVPTMYFRAIDLASLSSLETDDIAGITTAYPLTPPATGLGSISGEVKGPSGSALKGAAVVAIDGSDNEISVILGGNPDLDDTHYRLENVPPGVYTVELIPLNGSSISGQSNSSNSGEIDIIFSTPAFNLTPVFFDNTIVAGEATQVAVVADQDTPDIDFVGADVTGGDPSGLIGNVIQDQGGCQAVPLTHGSFGFLSSALSYFLLPLATILFFRKRLKP